MSKKTFLLIDYSDDNSNAVASENIYELVSEEKPITKTSQLINNGNGSSSFETVSGANIKFETKQHAYDTYETKQHAYDTYETKQHAFDTYESQEYAALTYESKENATAKYQDIVHKAIGTAIILKRTNVGTGVLGHFSVNLGYFATNLNPFTGASGSYSIILGGLNSFASGYSSAVVGGDNGVAIGVNSFVAGGKINRASSYCEFVSGSHPTHYAAESASQHRSVDRLVNFGNGTSNSDRSDAWTLFKNGAQKWFPKALNTVTNAVKGFVMMDEDARVHVHDGTGWNKLAIASEMGESYSLTEQVTGGTWIDGKPIYTITKLEGGPTPSGMDMFTARSIGVNTGSLKYVVYMYTKL